MAADDDHLTRAMRHVEEAQRIVWEQKGRIIRLRAAGVDTFDAERTLEVLQANLRTFQEHMASLSKSQIRERGSS
jgi:hypothetical protein